MTSVARICSIEECDDKYFSKGYCSKHYTRVRKYGDPYFTKRSLQMHGLRYSRLYTVWVAIRSRTTSPKSKNYKNYGGRGIRMCDGWMNSCELFCSMVGERPNENYSIDRIDNDKGYTCGRCEDCINTGQAMNVRWATRAQQANNRRMPKRNKSGYRGVSYDKYRRYYIATIRVNGKTTYVGSFKTAREAAFAYNKAATEYLGNEAKLNTL